MADLDGDGTQEVHISLKWVEEGMSQDIMLWYDGDTWHEHTLAQRGEP